MSAAVRTRSLASPAIVLFAALLIVAAQLVTAGPGTSQPPVRSQHAAAQPERAALQEAAAAMTATIVKPITPPAPAPPPAPPPAPTTTTTTAPPPAPAPAPAPAPTPAPAPAAAAPAPVATDPGVVPPIGQATAWGCTAALAYLQVYAAKGFTLECPGYAEGREAMTCVNQAGVCPGASVIAIADACPQAYMNEASNSLVLAGLSSAPIDPFGPCP